MILANFDLSFFTSIPGMLITGGVLLLLIALVIFIATGSKKDKKGKKGETQNVEASIDNNTVATTPTVDASVAPEPVVMPTVETQPMTAQPVDTSNVVSDNSSISTNTMDNPVPTVENAPAEVIVKSEEPAVVQTETPQVEVPKPVEPVITPTEEVQSNINTNTNKPINNMESVNVVPPTPVVSEPVNSPNTEVAEAPTITIVDKEESIPQVEIPKEEPKPIYGGASPVIPKIDVGEEHRPIYGGADPLENTGAIPTITSQEPPVVTPTIPTIEKEPTVESVEPVTVTAPQVEVPTIETPKVEVSNQEAVIPTVTESTPQVEVPSTPKKEEEIESLF